MDSGSHKWRRDLLERRGVGKLSKSTGKAGEPGWENRQQSREARLSEPSQGHWTPVATPWNMSQVSLLQISSPGRSLTRLGWFQVGDHILLSMESTVPGLSQACNKRLLN